MADSWYSQANDGVGGISDTEGIAHGAYDLYTAAKSADGITGNDLLRPLGLNYDAYEAPKPPVGGSAAVPETSFMDAGEGALGIVGGGLQFATGVSQAFGDKAQEHDRFDGGLNMLGGAASAVAGGLQLASGLGYGGAALLGTTVGAASAVAAPIAAAIGLGVAGDQYGEQLGLFGKDAEGNNRGAVQAAWDTGQAAGTAVDQALGGGALGLVGGALTAGVSTAGLEVGAAAADVGLGIESLGSSSGMFGTATSADGTTHNRGAFELLDTAGQAAGHGVDDLLGIDQDSTAGQIIGGGVRGLTDALGAGAALTANVVGGAVGGVEAAGSWLDSAGASSGLFGTTTGDDGKTHNMGAFEALDHAGTSAGNSVDNFLGIDQDSTAGKIVGGGVRALTDVAGSGLALAGDVVGGIGSAVGAVLSW
jgi:hypothetical protein